MKTISLLALLATSCAEPTDSRLGIYETVFTAEDNGCVHVTLPDEATETIEIYEVQDIEDSDDEVLLTYISGFNISTYLVSYAGFTNVASLDNAEVQGSRAYVAISGELEHGMIAGEFALLIRDAAWQGVDTAQMTPQELLEFLEKHPSPLCGAKYIFDGEKK